MAISEQFAQQALKELSLLYADAAPDVYQQLVAMCERHVRDTKPASRPLWNESDVVLITYGDQIRDEIASPLAALKRFLQEESLDGLINTVHLLPCFPYSSDDGFSVIDYRQIDPALGDWDDVAALRETSQVMFDLVLNHCSAKSQWFQDYLAGKPPYDGYFIAADPAADLSAVTRPRSLPLLSPFETSRGTKHLWTTFSDDQIDLNFANPAVLIEMLDVLLTYADHGARIVRLDAIAYLWKTIGTSCIHQPPTHAVVRLMRAVLDEVAPGTILLTETNVPHDENVSYFGDGDEAQMVYNFSLAPLLLDAFLTEDPTPLNSWLAALEPAEPGTTYFNFTASHDGIGVRPLEGLVDQDRFEQLATAVSQRGGYISTKRNADGSDSPYELNITFFSALGPTQAAPDQLSTDDHVRRFLSSQAIMLTLRGIPGIYFHSLVGTSNHQAGVEETGRARSINRRKFHRDELDGFLHAESAVQKQVFDGYRHLLKTRVAQPAFHPDAAQTFVKTDQPSVVAFLRECPQSGQRILVTTNVSGHTVSFRTPDAIQSLAGRDLLKSADLTAGHITLPPFATAWFEFN